MNDDQDFVLLLVDGTGRVERVNKTRDKSEGELQIGRDFEMMYTGGEQAGQLPGNLIEDTLKYGYFEYEGLITRKNGSQFQGRIALTALYTADNVLAGFSKTTVDISPDVEQASQPHEKSAVTYINKSTITNTQSRFRALIENSYDAISLLDEMGRIAYISPSGRRMLGYDPEEVITTAGLDFFHPDDRADVVARLEYSRLHPGEPIFRSSRVKHKDGHYIWTEGVTTNLLHDENVNAFVGNFRDISERKQAEELAAQRENRFRALVEHSRDAISMADENGRVIYRSPVSRKLFGDTENDTPESGLNNVAAADREMVKLSLAQAMQQPGVPIFITARMNSLTGHEIWVEGTVINLLHDDHVKAIVGNYADITERVRAQEQLLESRNRFRSLIENSNDGIGLVDANNLFVYVTPSVTRIMGYEAEELLGTDPTLLCHPDDVTMVAAMLGAVAARPGINLGADYRMRHKDGSWRYIKANVSNLLHLQGVNAFVINFKDDTERVLAHEEIKNSAANLKAIIDSSSESFILTDLTGVLLEFNEIAQRVNLLTCRQAMQLGRSMLDYIVPERVAVFQAYLLRAANNETIKYEQAFESFDGVTHHFEFSVYPVATPSNIQGICLNGRDVTAAKRAEQKIALINRLYSLVTQVNQAIVHAGDIEEVFAATCRIATETGGFKICWVGILGGTGRSVNYAAGSGITDTMRPLFESMTYHPGGPMAKVLETGQLVFSNDMATDFKVPMWEDVARESGLAAYMLLPLKKEGVVIGFLNLYSGDKNSFDSDEVELLRKISDDVSFAIASFEQQKQRSIMEQKVHHSEIRLNQAQATAHLGSWEYDEATETIIGSAEYCRIFGQDPANNQVAVEDWYAMVHPDDLERVTQLLAESSSTYQPCSFEYRAVLKDGTIKYISSETSYEFSGNDSRGSAYGIALDITARKEAEERIRYAKRLYSFISHINQTIVRAKEADTVFRDACRIAYELGLFKMAWIGIFNEDKSAINYVAGNGVPEEDRHYLGSIANRDGIQAYVLDANDVYVNNQISREFEVEGFADYAATRGIRSCMLLPIRQAGQIVGTLNLYAAEVNFFGKQEINLLEEVAEDISFALDSFEGERYRLQMETKLVNDEKRLRKAQQIARFGSWERDMATGILSWSDEACAIYGVPLTESIQSFESWLTFIHPDDLQELLDERSRSYETASNFILTHRIIRPDGQVRHLLTQSEFEFAKDGTIVKSFGVMHDVTDVRVAEQKLIQVNHYYAFISQINKTIVWARDQDTVFSRACDIATDVGKFKIAFICLFNDAARQIVFVAGSGLPQNSGHIFADLPYDYVGPQTYVMNNATSFITNDLLADPSTTDKLKGFARELGIKSGMVLPIRSGSKIIGTFSLYASDEGVFHGEQIEILEEVADDISFALDNFEKERQRKRMEEDLKHSEAHLRKAQAIAHIGNWEYDFDGGELICSEEYCRIYELPDGKTRITVEEWFRLVHADDLEAVTKIVKEAEANLNGSVFNYRLSLPSGAVKYVHCQTNFELDENGVPIGIYGIAHDITEQKIAEEKLENANRIYAFISQINQAIVQVGNAEGLFVKACEIATKFGRFDLAWVSMPDTALRKLNVVASSNLSAEELNMLEQLSYNAGGPIDRVMTRGEIAVINDFERDEVEDAFRRYAAIKGLRSCIVLPIRKAGLVIGAYNLISSKSELFDHEEIRLLEEATNDISYALDIFAKDDHRREIEGQLARNELRLKQAQAIAHFGSWELDMATDLVEWSEEACSIYGLDHNENMQNRSDWLTYIHPDDLDFVMTQTHNAHLTLSPAAFEHRIISRKGDVKYVLSQSEFQLDEQGKPVILRGVVHDITSIKLAELERTKMIEDIVQRNKDLEQFSYIVSHNLRSPVANISGLSQILSMTVGGESTAGRYVAELINSIKKLDDVIMDLNYILQIRHNDVKKLEKIKFSQILEDVEVSIDNLIKSNNVIIRENFADVEGIFTFKSYLNSVFFNLISNSIKYRQAAIDPIITITSSRDKDKITLTFTDNGLGIDLTKKSTQVFGLYKRFHDHVAGKGMGLYMVKTQIESLGGTVTIASEVNVGTTFTIEFNPI